MVDAYLQLGNTTKDNNWILYLCVEYEPTINIDLDLLLYCSELERNKTELEDKLRIIDMQNDFITNKTKKSRFTFFGEYVLLFSVFFTSNSIAFSTHIF